ncbi:hypothetical protein C0J52_14049 [Blattella germanica]|nr:hypothetical protein C0J52_14049 [Blattella germanica]
MCDIPCQVVFGYVLEGVERERHIEGLYLLEEKVRVEVSPPHLGAHVPARENIAMVKLEVTRMGYCTVPTRRGLIIKSTIRLITWPLLIKSTGGTPLDTAMLPLYEVLLEAAFFKLLV